jgi:hypothetical protein
MPRPRGGLIALPLAGLTSIALADGRERGRLSVISRRADAAPGSHRRL